MTDDQDDGKISRIRQALVEGSLAKPQEKPRKRGPKSEASNAIGDVSIGGSHNVVGNIVNLNPKPARPRVVVQPGDGVITSEQAAQLKALVTDIVALEEKLKRQPATFQAVWSSLNRKMMVSGYREIPALRFDKARSFLHQWMGRLNAAPSAPVKDGDAWRKRRYALIKINSKDAADAAALAAYLQRNFAAASLTELSNDELDRVYRYVAGRRNKRK